MNDSAATTSAPGASLIPDTTGAFTVLHLAIIAIFALLVLVAIVWGVRLKRQRKAADQRLREHNAAVIEGTAAPELTPAPARPVEPTVAATPAPAPAAPTPAAFTPTGHPAAGEPAAPAPIVPQPDRPSSSSDAPVTQLKGLGPKVAGRLGELGITTVGQIAALDDRQAAELDAQLGAFQGRMGRDRWIEQARFLAADDRAGFEAVFGKL